MFNILSHGLIRAAYKYNWSGVEFQVFVFVFLLSSGWDYHDDCPSPFIRSISCVPGLVDADRELMDNFYLGLFVGCLTSQATC